jgi:hypothetical protein
VRQPDLPDGRRGLTLLQAQGTLGQSELTAPERDRPGGNQDDLLTSLAQAQ